MAAVEDRFPKPKLGVRERIHLQEVLLEITLNDRLQDLGEGRKDGNWADNEVMSLFDVKDFVKGLKSRITSEISILLAIDPEASLDLENDPNSSMKSRSNPSNRNQVRDFITDNGRTNLRKFLPIPLLLGGRTRRN
eukprot:maker-scaffold25_size650667-snap-gene-1.15 protein:Tk06687 transcript:maker-scaffold25_size650667-snap-gene-1.15-mRNA-1 annotation:"family transcriptional regulator"